MLKLCVVYAIPFAWFYRRRLCNTFGPLIARSVVCSQDEALAAFKVTEEKVNPALTRYYRVLRHSFLSARCFRVSAHQG
eukprot:6991025-Pyramimonas_sp.AAC.1